MPEAPAALTSPSIRKLAQRAVKAPSLLTTAETRELGASVMAHLSPVKQDAPSPEKKASAKKTPAKAIVAKKSSAKKAVAKKVPSKTVSAKKIPAKSS